LNVVRVRLMGCRMQLSSRGGRVSAGQTLGPPCRAASAANLPPHAPYTQVAAQTLVMQPLPEDRALCSFGHIFTGGYRWGRGGGWARWGGAPAADPAGGWPEAALHCGPILTRQSRPPRSPLLARP
jgi:hypothetical protein